MTMPHYGKRPFRAEIQLMRKRVDAPVDSSHGVHGAARSELTGYEVREILEAFRHDLVEEIRTMAGGSNPSNGSDADLDGEVEELKTQVRSLAAAIEQTKDELAPLIRTSDANRRVDVMKSELRDIVFGQETATGSILDCMERIEEATQQIKQDSQSNVTRGAADGILDNVVQVFEHCNFQDLSGQRVNKVINTLNFIEERIDRIIEIWGEEVAAMDVGEEPAGGDGLERILTKPTKQNNHISQDEIDKMFE